MVTFLSVVIMLMATSDYYDRVPTRIIVWEVFHLLGAVCAVITAPVRGSINAGWRVLAMEAFEDLSASLRELMAANGVFLDALADSILRIEGFQNEATQVRSFLDDLAVEIEASVLRLAISPTPLPPRAEQYRREVFWGVLSDLMNAKLDSP